MENLLTFEEFLLENKNIPKFLYHFTYLSSLCEIISSGILYAKNIDEKHMLSISFTSDINFFKRSISGFKSDRKACALVVNSKKILKDNIELSPFVYKSIKNFDYAKENEYRAYPKDGQLNILKYIEEVILTKYANKNPFFVNKLENICKENNIKISNI